MVLSPRAVAVLKRQLALRERLQRAGRIKHEHLFFTVTGEPIRRLYTPYSHWRRTLRRLPMRYRKPYAARHSSVSWDLMIGRNPLWVAKQHGHSLLTMLRVYAAWAADSPETDAAGLQPHRTESFKLSTDPFFIEKLRDVVGLYLKPPQNALVLCADEESQREAPERTQPMLPLGMRYV